MGTKGHNDTVTYIYKQLTSPALRGYYNVSLQEWEGVIQVNGTGTLFIDGVNTTVTIAQFSPSGNASLPLAVVNNLGCNAVRISPSFSLQTPATSKLTSVKNNYRPTSPPPSPARSPWSHAAHAPSSPSRRWPARLARWPPSSTTTSAVS